MVRSYGSVAAALASYPIQLQVRARVALGVDQRILEADAEAVQFRDDGRGLVLQREALPF